jgi:pimeloyl-ACP methyl ester carboxylesterase
MNVLFIHGFGGMPFEYNAIKNHLVSELEITPFDFSYDKKWGTESLKVLGARAAKIMVSKKIDAVVGISMGGIIAATALEYHKTPTKTCITICSPWHGSSLAYALPFIGTKQMRPHSEFLSELRLKTKHTKVSYYCIWNPLDLMVFPGDRAINPYAKQNEYVYSILHPTTFFEEKTLQFCENSLKNVLKKHQKRPRVAKTKSK